VRYGRGSTAGDYLVSRNAYPPREGGSATRNSDSDSDLHEQSKHAAHSGTIAPEKSQTTQNSKLTLHITHTTQNALRRIGTSDASHRKAPSHTALPCVLRAESCRALRMVRVA